MSKHPGIGHSFKSRGCNHAKVNTADCELNCGNLICSKCAQDLETDIAEYLVCRKCKLNFDATKDVKCGCADCKRTMRIIGSKICDECKSIFCQDCLNTCNESECESNLDRRRAGNTCSDCTFKCNRCKCKFCETCFHKDLGVCYNCESKRSYHTDEYKDRKNGYCKRRIVRRIVEGGVETTDEEDGSDDEKEEDDTKSGLKRGRENEKLPPGKRRKLRVEKEM